MRLRQVAQIYLPAVRGIYRLSVATTNGGVAKLRLKPIRATPMFATAVR